MSHQPQQPRQSLQSQQSQPLQQSQQSQQPNNTNPQKPSALTPLNDAMRARPSLEQLARDKQLHPWSQTQTQRKELAVEIDHLTEQLLQCKQADCPDLKQLYLEGVSLMIALHTPKDHWDIHQCREKRVGDPRSCLMMFQDSYNKHYHLMDRKMEDKERKGFGVRTPRW